ncbi:MAG: hypothetical protein N2663_07890 [Chlorobi bacterium]|nr:hypothetical protein [Chlorobiota bacterium]
MSKSSRLRTLLKHSSILGLGQAVFYAIYFFGIRLILSTLPKEQIGELTYVQQWSTAALSIAMMTGYNTYIVHRLRSGTNLREVFSTVVWLRVIIGIVVAVFLAAMLAMISSVSPVTTLIGCCAVALMSNSYTLRYTFELYHHARMEFGILVALMIVDAVAIVIMLNVYAAHLSATIVLTIQTICTLPSVAILLLRTRKNGHLYARIDKSALEELFGTARPLSVVTALVYTHMLVDITLLQRLAGSEMVGIYGGSLYAGLPLMVLQGVLWSPLIPLLSRSLVESPQSAEAELSRGIRMVTLVIVCVACLLAACMPLIIAILTSGRFNDYQVEFYLQLLLATLGSLVFATQSIGALIGHYRVSSLSAAMLLLGSLCFDWWLISANQTNGLLVAKMLSNLLAIGAATVWWLRSRYHSVAWILVRSVVWIGFLAGAVWGTIVWIDSLILRSVLLALVAGFSAYAIGILQWEDRALIGVLMSRYRASPYRSSEKC